MTYSEQDIQLRDFKQWLIRRSGNDMIWRLFVHLYRSNYVRRGGRPDGVSLYKEMSENLRASSDDFIVKAFLWDDIDLEGSNSDFWAELSFAWRVFYANYDPLKGAFKKVLDASKGG